MFERFVGGAVVGEVATACEECDLVAEHHVLGGVGDEDDGVAIVGKAAKEAHQLAFDARVKARSRFVEEEEAGLGEEFGADRDALTLTAAQGADRDVAPLIEAERLQDGFHAFFALSRGCVVGQAKCRGILECLRHGEFLVKDVVLGDVADGGAEGVEVVVERGTVEEDFAIGCRLEAAQCPQQR